MLNLVVRKVTGRLQKVKVLHVHSMKAFRGTGGVEV